MSITKEEFEKNYAENSKMSIEELRKTGLYAAPCDCEYENCKGWQMKVGINVSLKACTDTIKDQKRDES